MQKFKRFLRKARIALRIASKVDIAIEQFENLIKSETLSIETGWPIVREVADTIKLATPEETDAVIDRITGFVDEVVELGLPFEEVIRILKDLKQ